MIDWLKRNPREEPFIEIAGNRLPITLRRHATAKRMTMRVSPDGTEIRITLPKWGRSAEAIAFAQSRRDWLAKQVSSRQAPLALEHGSTIPFRGKRATLHHDESATRRVTFDGEIIRAGGPFASLEGRVRRWMEGEVRADLTTDLAEYCQIAGKPTPPLALSNARRRWGSCATDGSIRINWRLIMAPDWVRRSVVAHEVAHLVHFDHSPRFHAFLAELYEGDIDIANTWLKKHGPTLYLLFA